jgi:hypothetical protein
MSKKLKDFVKQNTPNVSKFGTNPMDPWSAKANLSESPLDKYLASKGINPKYVSKDTKIAYAKSNEFKLWAQNHRFEEFDPELNEDDDHLIKSPTKKRLADLRSHQSIHKEIGVAHTNPVKEAYGNENEEYEEEEQFEGEQEELQESEQIVEGISDMLNDAFEGNNIKNLQKVTRENIHPFHRFRYDIESIENVKDSHDMIKKAKASGHYIIKPINESRGHKVLKTWMKNQELMMKSVHDSKKAMYHATNAHDTHVKNRVTDTLVGRVPGGEDNEHYSYKVDIKKEGAEVTTDMIKGRVVGGKPNDFKSFKVKLRSASGGPDASGIKVSEDNELDEDKYQDASASTQTVGMEVESKKKLNNSLVSKRRMSEDMYDHEKEDKSVATYGKKPKMEKAEKEDSGVGENKPQAVGVMSGGTTLTGEKRDTVEIDPMMRNRPGQPDVTKKDDKKKDDDKKDVKKQEAK